MNVLRALGVLLVFCGVVAGGMVLANSPPEEPRPELLSVEAGWVPEDFMLVSAVSGERSAWKIYEREEGGSITVEQVREDGKPLTLDTEGGVAEKVTVQGREGILSEKGSSVWVVVPLPESKTALLVSGKGVDAEDVVEVAEHVSV